VVGAFGLCAALACGKLGYTPRECSGCWVAGECFPGDEVDRCGRVGRDCVACGGETPLCGALACMVPHPIVELTVGNEHQCARDAEGRVYCWGVDTAGQLGARDPGGACRTATPVLVPLPAPAATIHAARDGTCATLIDGRGHCWGRGLAGDGTTSEPSTCLDGATVVTRDAPASIDPVEVVPSEPPFEWRALGDGVDMRYGVSTAGTVFYWGVYGYEFAPRSDLPTRASTAPAVFVAMRTNSQFGLGLSEAGDLFAWGPTPFPVADRDLPIASRVGAFAAGWEHACWSFGDGSIECNGAAMPAWPPGPSGGRMVPGARGSPVTSIGTTYLAAPAVVCWTNARFELRCTWLGEAALALGPEPARDFVSVSIGLYRIGALDLAGRAWTWHMADRPEGPYVSTTTLAP
jgi:hypothetical protein